MHKFGCRICGSAGYSTILDGTLPLAAEVCAHPSNNLERYPLYVVRCNTCGHIQLLESVSVNLYEEYLFTPSYMKEFDEQAETFCKLLDQLTGARTKRVLLEIGSSNGSLLKKLKEKGWEVLGIEPSAPMVNAAKADGIDTIHGYFAESALDIIQNRIGQPSVIILRHVLEHLENLGEMIALIHQVLGDGLLVIEVPYVQKTIQENRFYDFFHEHLSYFSVSSLNNLLLQGDFHIHHVHETPEVGGSILIFADTDHNSRPDDNVAEYLIAERKQLSADCIAAFSEQITKHISRLKGIVEDATLEGETVAGWGAGQRGCTLIAHCGFQSNHLQYVIDANENYWWRYVPGTDIQIVPPNYYQEHMVDKMLIFATGYADSIIRTNTEFERLGGAFVKISNV